MQAHQNWIRKFGKMLLALVSLDFCCKIQMVGSEFDVNSNLHCINSSGYCWWCNRVGRCSWHILGLQVTDYIFLNLTANLSIAPDHVYAPMTTVYPSSDGYLRRITRHA